MAITVTYKVQVEYHYSDIEDIFIMTVVKNNLRDCKKDALWDFLINHNDKAIKCLEFYNFKEIKI